MTSESHVRWASSAELHDELTAARKTVAVLKRKVHALMSGAEKSVIEKQLIQTQKRSESMATRRELAELRASELERYSAQLEGDVEARTRTIRTILDNVTFGFLLVDASLTVQTGYTKSCHALFGGQDIAGRPLKEVLELSPREAADWRLSVDQVFDDVLPEEVSVGQLRSRFSAGGRTLRIDARPVRTDDGIVAHLLLSIADISALEAAESSAEHAKALVEILRQREPFRNFVRDARQRLDLALVSQDPNVVRSAVHTIKGNAACFGLTEVAALAHRVEDEGVDAGQISPAGLKEIEAALRGFLKANMQVLGVDLDDRGDAGAVLSSDQVRRLVALTADAPAELSELVTAITRRPATDLLGPMERMVERLASQLGKDVQFRLDGGNTLIDAAHQDVFGVLGHLVRNAIDHGISEAGEVAIIVAESPDGWTVSVTDNGRGINCDQVARKALERHVCSAADLDVMSDEDKLQLVFVDGLSTAAATTDVSGRGVGMGAVLQAVDKAGGTLRIRSAPGRGTSIELGLPMH